MKKENENRHINDEIIARYLSGEATEAEMEQLYTWISREAANKSYFLYFKELWFVSNQPPTIDKIDTEKAFDTFIKRKREYEIENNDKAKSKKIYLKVIISAAAGVILLIGLWQLFLKQPKQIFTESGKSILKIDLPDGSTALLARNSTISYSEGFKGEYREVDMKGKVYFEVNNNQEKKFRVITDDIEVEVVGTSFFIDASNGSKEIIVYVGTGKVNIIHQQQTPQLAIAGEKVVFNAINKNIIISSIEDQNYIAWKTKKLTFKNTPIVEVIKLLEEVYNFNIEIVNDSIKNCKLTAKFDDEPIDNIFKMLEMAFQIEVSKEGGTYYLVGEGCL